MWLLIRYRGTRSTADFIARISIGRASSTVHFVDSALHRPALHWSHFIDVHAIGDGLNRQRTSSTVECIDEDFICHVCYCSFYCPLVCGCLGLLPIPCNNIGSTRSQRWRDHRRHRTISKGNSSRSNRLDTSEYLTSKGQEAIL